MNPTYKENFNNGPNGWMRITGNGDDGVRPIVIENGAMIARSPWWVDYNHAPPGAGYLHLLGALHTTHPPTFPDVFRVTGGENKFIAEGHPTDFTNAKLTIRLRGEIDLKGAQLLFLAQGRVGDHIVGQLLTGEPFQITPDWTEQTATLSPDPEYWTCLGARHDRGETYGHSEAAAVLNKLDVDFMFVLYPLNIVPAEPVNDIHNPKAGEDYHLDRTHLPKGWIAIDEINIEFSCPIST